VKPALTWMIDPVTRELRPRVVIVMGLGIFAVGAFALWQSADAVLDGRQYAGGTPRRNFGTRVPADIAMLLSAFMALCGGGFMAVGISQAFPGLGKYEWLKKLVGWATLIAIVVLLLATLGVAVVRILT
jgi:hypothetical protein